MRDLSGKVAVVTGAASGIGRAMADCFAAQGMMVVLADVEERALDAAVMELQQQERDVLGVVTDVRKPDELQELARRAIDQYGKVHVICNNAGVITTGGGQGVVGAALENWEWVLQVNFWGVLHGVRTFLPILERQGEEGHIVNTASIAGLMAPGAVSAYSVSKHAVVALSEGLYSELQSRESRVGVSVLCPGFVRTNLHEAGRNRPEELTPADDIARGEPSVQAGSLAASIEGGASPDRIAEAVLEAIREEHFYILPHAGTEAVVRSRMEAIIEGRNPEALGLAGLRNPE